MGKQNNKAPKGKKSGLKTSSPKQPSFDEQALSALTAKLEKDLEKGIPQQPDTSNGKRKEGRSSDSSRSANSKPKPNIPELKKGTKRDAHGNVKVAGKQSSEKEHTSGKGHNGAGQDERSVLLQEILALGGTEEDLDLVAGADSEDGDADGESNDVGPKGNSLKRQLAKFVAELGLEGQVPEEEAESNLDDEEVEEAGDWEKASNSDISEAPELAEVPPAKKIVAPAPQQKPAPNGPYKLIFEARPDWHAAQLPTLPSPELNDDPEEYQIAISNLKTYAMSLLEADSNLYNSKHLSASSSHRFLSTIMSSGTLSDKVSALTLVVQESPVHTTKSFENLLGLAKKRSRGQAVTALGAMKDLLAAGVVLPADRRLRTFVTQPGLLGTLQKSAVVSWNSSQRLPGTISKAHLISWAYEDWLKEQYFEMLKVLEGWCSDEIEYSRSRAVTYVYELLKEKPEQEANLLRLLVNKLGDPEKKIASRTSYLLLQLQISHPLMKPIIIRSVETELLLRPGQSSHAKYYAINTLNQTILSGKEEEVAKKLLGIYFELFVSLLKKPEPVKVVGPVVNKKGQVQGGGAPMGKKAKDKALKEEDAKMANEEMTEKMISAVLSGVNRAFPFSKTDDQTLEEHMDTLFKITHSSNFNTSVQALMLIEQLATSKHLAVDRFYRTLYESLLDPRLVNSSKHALYLNLLFRSLKADLNVKRVKAFAKRLLQVITLHQPPFVCGVLYLLSELEVTFPGLKTLLTEPEANDEADEEVFRDVPEDGEAPIESTEPSKASQQPVYDGRKREPEHSNAEKSCLWESLPFLVHFHPSVSLFADRLIKDEKMPPKPDLASHTLSSFLDKFVYRNAKSAASGPRGGSIMQPLAGSDNRGLIMSNKTKTHSTTPVNTEAFWHKKAEDVAVDEVFFHKYFNQIGKSKKTSTEKKASKGTADPDSEEDEDEDKIWQALVNSRPEVEGPSDDESDMEILDLEDSDAELSASSDIDVEEDGGAILEDVGSEDESMGDFDFEDEDDIVDIEGSEAGSEIDELFEKELRTAGKATEEAPENSRQKKRRLKGLPTFVSVDDYAAMLDNDEDEDL